MDRYERITLNSAQVELKGPKTFILRITKETDIFLFGIEVDKTGDEVVRPKADVTQHVISKDLIIKRVPLKMNNFYGWLETVK